jgi:ribosome modulation factor
MKITPEDMQTVRNLFHTCHPRICLCAPEGRKLRDMALLSLLCDIYDRGYDRGQDDAIDGERLASRGECPFTHAHTRHWCGYAGCRDS